MTPRTIWLKTYTKDTKVQSKSKDIPRNNFFGRITLSRVVEDNYMGLLKVFLDSQEYLAAVQHERHQGVRQEQRRPQGLIIWESCRNRWYKVWLYWPSKGVVQHHGYQGVGQEQDWFFFWKFVEICDRMWIGFVKDNHMIIYVWFH